MSKKPDLIPSRLAGQVRNHAISYRQRRWRAGLDDSLEVCYSEILESLLHAQSEDGEITRAIAALCGVDERHERLLARLTESWIATAQRITIGRG